MRRRLSLLRSFLCIRYLTPRLLMGRTTIRPNGRVLQGLTGSVSVSGHGPVSCSPRLRGTAVVPDRSATSRWQRTPISLSRSVAGSASGMPGSDRSIAMRRPPLLNSHGRNIRPPGFAPRPDPGGARCVQPCVVVVPTPHDSAKSVCEQTAHSQVAVSRRFQTSALAGAGARSYGSGQPAGACSASRTAPRSISLLKGFSRKYAPLRAAASGKSRSG